MAKDFKKVFAGPKVVPLHRALFKKPRLVRRKRAEEGKWQRVKLALLVRVEAKLGKENELANCLRAGLAQVQQEPATVSWFAIRLGPSTFALFDAFADEAGRQAHLKGSLAATLKEITSKQLARPPMIEKVDVLAAKLADFGDLDQV
jgi:quinol monooxygenase YgiN